MIHYKIHKLLGTTENTNHYYLYYNINIQPIPYVSLIETFIQEDKITKDRLSILFDNYNIKYPLSNDIYTKEEVIEFKINKITTKKNTP